MFEKFSVIANVLPFYAYPESWGRLKMLSRQVKAVMEDSQQELEHLDRVSFEDRTGIIRLMEQHKLDKFVIESFKDRQILLLFDFMYNVPSEFYKELVAYKIPNLKCLNIGFFYGMAEGNHYLIDEYQLPSRIDEIGFDYQGDGDFIEMTELLENILKTAKGRVTFKTIFFTDEAICRIIEACHDKQEICFKKCSFEYLTKDLEFDGDLNFKMKQMVFNDFKFSIKNSLRFLKALGKTSFKDSVELIKVDGAYETNKMHDESTEKIIKVTLRNIGFEGELDVNVYDNALIQLFVF